MKIYCKTCKKEIKGKDRAFGITALDEAVLCELCFYKRRVAQLQTELKKRIMK